MQNLPILKFVKFNRMLIIYIMLFSLFSGQTYANSVKQAVDEYYKGNFKKSVEMLTPFVKKEDAQAQNLMGVILYFGNSKVKKDYDKSFQFFMASAKQGNGIAQWNLGERFFFADGKYQDYNAALKWLKLAADQNISGAKYMIGNMYYLGKGVTKDYKEALKWLEVNGGSYYRSAYILGKMYVEGEGVKKDGVKAFNYFRKAANKYNPSDASYILATMYEEGKYTEKNEDSAFKYFLKAAEIGHKEAQYTIANYFLQGFPSIDLEVNEMGALLWSTRAAEQGHEKAKILNEELQMKIIGKVEPIKEIPKWKCIITEKNRGCTRYETPRVFIKAKQKSS
ncbi:MAG: sel1 repeat family protein [Oceanospirillaceae bacterium]|nr:sel1 repeat family protein [Oceanospirillaceae bacterium]